MTLLGIRLIWVFCCASGLAEVETVLAEDGPTVSGRDGERLLAEADQIHVPTTFLKEIPPEFVQFEFDDLQTYAAEYHPGEHRMILNRSLSFNAAGGMLKPLTTMTHKELEVLYHELFHAYMDYQAVRGEQPSEARGKLKGLIGFARKE